jgi:CRP-like cAMP-binding protein
MPDALLDLTADLPVRRLAAGEALFTQGDDSSTVVVLVEGTLEVRVGDVVVSRLSAPGSIVGEIGALLGQPRNASVTALSEVGVREISDPDEMFAAHPALGLEVARQLAGRLDRLNAYVVDVQRQFADRDDHLGMFAEVLSRMAARPVVDIEPGSDRSPDY